MGTFPQIHVPPCRRHSVGQRDSLAGFTLVELLVAIGVAAILVSIAMPSFKSAIERNRIASITNELIGALTYGRNEAITRNQSVVVCVVSDPLASVPVCKSGGSAITWETGWIVFVDIDNDRSFNSGDALLGAYSSAPAGYSIGTTGMVEWVAFNANGNASFDQGSLGTTFNIASSESDSAAMARSLVVSSTGRVRLEDEDDD